MKDSELNRIIEALLFASPEPLTQTKVNMIFSPDTPNLKRTIETLNKQYEKESHAFEIKNIAVAESFQNKGIAKLLLARCEMIAHQLNMSWLKIATGNSSTQQLKLYQNCGFRPYSIERNFFANYPRPIVENGVRCLDKICLRMPIKKS